MTNSAITDTKSRLCCECTSGACDKQLRCLSTIRSTARSGARARHVTNSSAVWFALPICYLHVTLPLVLSSSFAPTQRWTALRANAAMGVYYLNACGVFVLHANAAMDGPSRQRSDGFVLSSYFSGPWRGVWMAHRVCKGRGVLQLCESSSYFSGHSVLRGGVWMVCRVSAGRGALQPCESYRW